MAIFKRGRVYWYNFIFNGQHIQESTKQGNPRVARQMEAAHRTALAKGEVGIREKKLAPTLKEFINDRVEPQVKAAFEHNSPHTYIRWFRPGFRAICAYTPLASLRLDGITGEHAAEFAAHRQTEGLAVSSVNSNLRVLRRILGLAVEWGVLTAVPKLKLLPGEHHRDMVVDSDEEAAYLTAAPEPLYSIATVMFDSGLRLDECLSLRWEYVNFMKGKYGAFKVVKGKTPAARRELPMTPLVRSVLENRWLVAGKSRIGYVWPGEARAGYVHAETLRRMHVKALEESKVRPFVFHSIRHTFLTRLGESGCDVWTLAKVAGHSNIKVSARYVHPSENAAQSAFRRLEQHQAAVKMLTEERQAPTTIPTTHQDQTEQSVVIVSSPRQDVMAVS
jgi:integrase